jgi:cytochrome c oxidase subunit 3
MGTGIHALHVLIGASLLGWVLIRSWKYEAYGPGEYTMVENSALYWHLVDLVWIFLFPLLYLIH